MSEHAEHEQHEHENHIVSPRIYVLIFLALLVGTALTIGARELVRRSQREHGAPPLKDAA
jgi:hypothetical protein